ncbi:response regulator [Geomonas terrae]|uniref:histidine kinase n=1 Tax=Geomonas terrae TaxID=2562681 RepID=A0A4S1CLZ8_9BACT|nr:ATP-binding protein [Geomonas terrae]TGU74613.1 response regulator [Geomonas terrae]
MEPMLICCCETLGPEVKGAIVQGRIAGFDCRTFHGCCGRPPLNWEDVRRICDGQPAILVGGECLASLGSVPDDMHRVLVLKKQHCAAVVCGERTFERLTTAGSFVVTSGWVANWRGFLDGWGFDRATAVDFFAESCAGITLLDTGSNPEGEEAVREFGTFVQRPVEVLPVPPELLALQLEKARGELQRLETEGRGTAPASDYALLLDMLSRVAKSDGEERVVDDMLAFFSLLFGAEELAYIPAASGKALRRYGVQATGEETLRALAQRMDAGFHIEEAARCFMVRLSHDDVVGWLWFGGFATPEHTRSYLNLAVTAADVCAMAISSARSVHRDLKEREEKYRLLFENMGNGFALLQMLLGPEGMAADFRFVEVNPAFESFTGQKAQELVGRTLLDVLPGFDTVQLETLGRLVLEGTPIALERYSIDARCCQVWLFRAKPGYCGLIINDITKQKLLEDKLRESVKMESVGRLAGGVAHDYNNMLSVIIGYTELLLMEFHGNRRITECLREICKAAEHSRDVTAQLLSFSRQQLISPKTLDINDAVSALAARWSTMWGAGIRVSLSLDESLWKVKIDPAQMEQVVSNIVRNAAAAMPDGGDLTIITRNVTLGEDDCSSHLDALPGDYAELAIADTGHGMDAETCRHIFEPFFTTREVGSGSGLGLATVYGMVTQNGGFVTVTSAPEAGTTFRIYLPSHVDRVAEHRALPAAHGSGTVLVIEDDEIVGRMTEKMLEHMGYRVLMAENSAQAIELCRDRETAIDLVLSDVMLPGASGREAVERILTLRPGLKIIYMSGYAAETLREKGVDRARVNFLQKPFDMASLNATIKSVLSESFATG